MTCDERLEALLNQAGMTMSDLPIRSDNDEDIYPYYGKARLAAKAAALDWFRISPADTDLIDEARAMSIYICHLVDIIDRMETALENVCGERDWLVKQYVGCDSCIAADDITFRNNDEPCYSCKNESNLEWEIPEDWSVDDA